MTRCPARCRTVSADVLLGPDGEVGPGVGSSLGVTEALVGADAVPVDRATGRPDRDSGIAATARPTSTVAPRATSSRRRRRGHDAPPDTGLIRLRRPPIMLCPCPAGWRRARASRWPPPPRET